MLPDVRDARLEESRPRQAWAEARRNSRRGDPLLHPRRRFSRRQHPHGDV